MEGHTRFEKRLRHDLSAKNQLRKEIERRLGQIRRWEQELAGAHSTRWRKRYAATIERLQEEVEQMKGVLAGENAELARRIQQEMAFSEEEVAAFEKRFTTERAEVVARRYEADKARKAGDGEGDVSLGRILARLQRQITKDERDVEQVRRELDSEARDRQLFEAELQRIVAENAHFGLNQG